MGTYTTNLYLYKPTVGENGWGTLVNENFDKLDSASSATGTVQMYAGSTAPNGWLICNGQTVSRTTYAALFAVIGTTYGAGDGSTTFNVPNLVNKTVRGAETVGSTGGADTVALGTENLPVHTHGGGSLTAASAGGHSHSVAKRNATISGSVNAVEINSGLGTQSAVGGCVYSSGAHTHTISGETDSTGSGSAVDITNPYVMLHYIIKT